MKVPQLKKKLEIKTCHNIDWEDNYSWIHQDNILEVLRDKSKLDPEVKKYLEDENAYTDHHLKDTKDIQKKLFDEIKGRIKLDDESLPYKDHTYEYWTKTTTKGNYSIKLRKKIGSDEIEEIWNGDKEKEKLKTEYFGIGDLEVSYNDKYLGYSLDLKGSEYYTIYLRDILSGKEITEKIEETSGSITFSLDDKYIFYSKLDEFHRPRKIYRHKIGTSIKNDELIFEEKSEAFTVGISLSSDEKYFFITTSDHNTSEQYYFKVNEHKPEPKLIKKRKRGTIYSISSWNNYFYCHTNEDAEDFKIERCSDLSKQNWEVYINAKDEVLIGGLIFLNDWIIRSEKSNALGKLYLRDIKTNKIIGITCHGSKKLILAALEDKPNYLDLEVEVEEKPTGYFSIQGGYSSVEALLLGVQIQENNLFGYGKSLGASVTVGTVSQNFLIDYFDPYFLDTSYQFGLQLFKREYQYIDYDRARWGGVLQFGKELNTWTFARLKYRFESIKVDDLNSVATEVLQESKDKISSVTLGLTYDTRDNFMDPSKGISSSLYIQESNSYLGANLHFTEYTASFGKYYSFIPNHTLAFTADGAFIDFRNVGDRLIVSERYYLGGPENLRGYKFARVSPRRTLSNGKFVRIGGNKYVYSAFEYLYPLALETGLKGILFIDVGETYEETQTIDLNPWDMKKDIGFGFRWLSPVGPLKLDFGFPLGNRESDESKFEVQFSFGSVF